MFIFYFLSHLIKLDLRNWRQPEGKYYTDVLQRITDRITTGKEGIKVRSGDPSLEIFDTQTWHAITEYVRKLKEDYKNPFPGEPGYAPRVRREEHGSCSQEEHGSCGQDENGFAPGCGVLF